MTRSSSEERAAVARGMATGAILSIFMFTIGMLALPPGKQQDFPTRLEHLIYTLRWQSLTAITFLFGIVRIASMRFFTTAMDPLSGKGEYLIAVDTRYLQNTLEQFLLSVTGHVILSTYLSAHMQSRAVPSLVVIFVTGRVLFYVGYSQSSVKRAAGFAMTFYPSVAVHLYCLFCFIRY